MNLPALGPCSLFPDLAPGTRKVRCRTGLGASRQNVARSRKEVRAYGVLQGSHQFGETPPLWFFFFFAASVYACVFCACARAHFFPFKHMYVKKNPRQERAEPGRGGDLRVTLRREGSRGCRRGRLRLWAKAEHRQPVGLRDPATASRPGVRGGALM